MRSFQQTPIPGIPDSEKNNIPSFYTNNKSNVLCLNENLLLRWLELNYEVQNPGKKMRLKNFDKDLRNGIHFASVIKNYVRGSERVQKELKMMKTKLSQL